MTVYQNSENFRVNFSLSDDYNSSSLPTEYCTSLQKVLRKQSILIKMLHWQGLRNSMLIIIIKNNGKKPPIHNLSSHGCVKRHYTALGTI